MRSSSFGVSSRHSRAPAWTPKRLLAGRASIYTEYELSLPSLQGCAGRGDGARHAGGISLLDESSLLVRLRTPAYPDPWKTIKPRSSPGGASSAPHLTGHFEVGGSMLETSEIDEPEDLA
jgi:hypothetical protein